MDLLSAKRQVFRTSKNYLGASLLATFLQYSLSIYVVLASPLLVIFPILSTILQILIFGFKYLSSTDHGTAERIRRSLLIENGLGKFLSESERAKLLDEVGADAFNKSNDDNYYESKKQHGATRLTELIQESSFFTSRLSFTCAKLLTAAVALGLIIVIFGFTYSISKVGSAEILIAIKIITLSMTFWATGDLAAMALKFYAMGRKTEGIYDHASSLLSKNAEPTEYEALLVFNDYNCAVITAPPIPDFVFNRRCTGLNAAWTKRKVNV